MWSYQLAGPARFNRVDATPPAAARLSSEQLLLRVLAGGICGSDLPLFRGLPPLQTAARVGAPGYPLHEVVGEVVASGSEAFVPGTRVVGWAREMNAISEYLIVWSEDVQPYDPSLSPTTAVLLQPLACVLSALQPVAVDVPSSAAVIGQGSIGILFSHVLKSLGVKRVIGVDPIDRSDVAGAFGVDEVVQDLARAWGTGLNEADRPELVVEAVGHQVATLVDAVEAVADGGRIFYFGIPDDPVYPFPMYRFLRKNATMWSGYTRDKQAALSAARAYLVDHPDLASSYITDVFSAQDVQGAFERAARPAVGRLKVVLDMAS